MEPNLNKISPDIVHTHGSKTTSIIKSINNNAYKHVATVHGIKKNSKVYECADFIIGVSENALDILLRVQSVQRMRLLVPVPKLIRLL